MIKLVNVDEMRSIEAAADLAGVSYAQMMEQAGHAVAERVKALLEARGGSRVVVLVGPGNNGGDGLVAGRVLAAEARANVAFYLARPRDDELIKAVRAAHLTVIDKPDYDGLRTLIAGADVIIDALLGTGSTLPIRGEIEAILKHTRLTLEGRRAMLRPLSRMITPSQIESPHDDGGKLPIIVAVDMPSGVDANTGAVDACTLHADETITFEAAKLGHYAFPAADYIGLLHVAPLELPANLPERDKLKRCVVTAEQVRDLLPPRPSNANKGTFGKALIFGGSQTYVGAPGLSALAAYRIGTGLVTVAAPDSIIPSLASQMLEVTWLPLPDGTQPDSKTITDAGASMAYTYMPDYSAMLIGPGLGRALNIFALLEKILDFGEGQIPPLVIDADGLNMLATMDGWWPKLPHRTILTPHPGEMARLAKIKPEQGKSAPQVVQSRRLELATEKAAAWKCVIVLKGAYTIIADPDGRIALVPFADAALARAGTGDVLAGMAVGLLAQGLDPFDAAVAAAYLHGCAGKMAGQVVGTRSAVLASDVIAMLPSVLGEIEGQARPL